MPHESGYTDVQLVQAIKDSRHIEKAVRYVYDSYYRLMEQCVLQNQGSEADAEDIVQEVLVVFVDLVRKDKFRGESKVGTLLYSITRNVWLNEMKRRKKSMERETRFENQYEKTDMDAGYMLAQKEAQKEVENLFNKLGEQCRNLLRRFYFDNLSMKEILAEFNYQNEQVLRNKKYKCMQSLLQLLEASPDLKKRVKSALQYA